MKKIPCLFQRDFNTGRKPVLLETVTPGCEWVLSGEGVATQKRDGTACMVKDGKLYKRYDAKGKGDWRPVGFIVIEQDPDIRGSQPGWIPVGDEPESRWHREAWEFHREYHPHDPVQDGTYELIGPKVQGNAEDAPVHCLARHGADEFPTAPRTFNALREWLAPRDIEGIVFHHPDGRMAKIRKADYGLLRKPVTE